MDNTYFQITNPNIKYQTHKWKFPTPENPFRRSACVSREQRHPLTCTIWVTSTLNICLYDLSEGNTYTVAELPFNEHLSMDFRAASICHLHSLHGRTNLTSGLYTRCLFISPLNPFGSFHIL